MLIVLRENQLCKTSTQYRKNPKQSGIVGTDSCFALFGARQYGVTTRDQALILRHTRHAIRFFPKARKEERLCNVAKECLRGRDTQYISDHF